MHRLQELVRLHRLGTGAREVARMLGMSPNTERSYREAIADAGLLGGDPEQLPELAALRTVVEAAKPPLEPLEQHKSSVEQWRDVISKLVDEGATPKAIHDHLRTTKADFDGSLSAVKRMCGRLRTDKGIDADDVAIPVDTKPGEVAQVDFGSVGKLWDPETRRVLAAYVFVMVLAFSRHMFARLVFNQRVETWQALHVEAFEFFGAVPEVIVPDNLKAAVTRAAFDVQTEPVLNRSYRELARHYGFLIDPTPAYSPQKKGKVEAGVRYVKGNFMATTGDERDVTVLNPMLDHWVVEVAGKRIHGTTRKQPLEVFEQVEKPTMRSLPPTRWRPISWRTPKLQRDSHCVIAGARYSAPWRLIGKRLLARLEAKSVELYWEDTRVATHPRKPAGSRSTIDAHLPPERSEYRHRERGYWIERAHDLGPDVEGYIEEVFASDDVLRQLTKVQSIIRHLETFPIERARAACRRAAYFGNYSYQGIKDILRKGLDLDPLPTLVVPDRGAIDSPRFARNVQELLDFTVENNDAPH